MTRQEAVKSLQRQYNEFDGTINYVHLRDLQGQIEDDLFNQLVELYNDKKPITYNLLQNLKTEVNPTIEQILPENHIMAAAERIEKPGDPDVIIAVEVTEKGVQPINTSSRSILLTRSTYPELIRDVRRVYLGLNQ